MRSQVTPLDLSGVFGIQHVTGTSGFCLGFREAAQGSSCWVLGGKSQIILNKSQSLCKMQSTRQQKIFSLRISPCQRGGRRRVGGCRELGKQDLHFSNQPKGGSAGERCLPSSMALSPIYARSPPLAHLLGTQEVLQQPMPEPGGGRSF